MYFEFTEKEFYRNTDEKEKDISLIKNQFKSLIKKHHPDNGGSHSIFVLLPKEMDKLLKKIDSTRIVDTEILKIEKFIKVNNHPDYPNYSKGYAKLLWNYYSYLYNFEKSFSLLYDYEEVKLLNENLGINIAFPLYSKLNSYKVQIIFKSDRKTINRNIESIFQSLRENLKNNYLGLIFTFVVDNGSIQTF